MKKYAIFLFALTLLFSCGKDYENPNYIEVNGQSHPLRYAFYEDYLTTVWGVDRPYREYYIELQSEESVLPSTMLGFYLRSWNLEGIGDGTYYFSENSGDFYQAFSGINMRYDVKGALIGGLFLENLDPSYRNTITIQSGKRHKIFDINLRFVQGNQNYTVVAHYEADMVEHAPIIKY